MPASIKATIKSSGVPTEIPVEQPSVFDVKRLEESPPLSQVGVTVGHTKNLGNFESLNIVVSRTDHTPTPDATHANLLEWCMEKMVSTFDTILATAKGGDTTTGKAAKINPAAKFQASDDLDL